MQKAVHQRAYPDAEVAALVESIAGALKKLADRFDDLRPALERGTTLGELAGLSGADCEALYKVACRLCDEGEYRHALPIALYLAAHGSDSRFCFIAGACLQRLGMPREAAPVYGMCLLHEPDNKVAAMFRMGECFAAVGDAESAIEAFEESIDLGRADARHRKVQDLASARVAELRQGRERRLHQVDRKGSSHG